MPDRLKPIATVFEGALAALEARAKAADAMTLRVRAALQGPEKDHVLSASCRGDTLVVIADSAQWSTYIRYAEAQLFAALSDSEVPLTKLKVKVRGKTGGA
jgi:hypothetical protein